VNFGSAEEFDLHVHKCFGRMFELLMKVDAVVKEGAEKEEATGNYGVMTDMRDWLEEIILHGHLAWQYHRLSKGGLSRPDTWDAVEGAQEAKKNS
jgi:hypothetical protein